MDKIYLKGMEFYGYHGVFSEENTLGQPFIVDLTMKANLKPAAKDDDLEKSVNYADAYQAVKKAVEENTFDLVETVAETIAEIILNTFSIVYEATVFVKKPTPPIAGHYEYVGIEITRSRS
ncbi:dihydroneopterin aldolase [Alteribacillus persepolensis]|uniref:7,8-dihydroneopterin aldolase n=1 Tax=Alteribacillus persepolensis TaxID=568899 RepID=A0A1G8I1V7_9BACI|nr:dihydroneopterin aldolase [Alteribacillus persepolensis]SDI12837.1 dihydroneopterin aldolase [Alteribacillus persepolensis]